MERRGRAGSEARFRCVGAFTHHLSFLSPHRAARAAAVAALALGVATLLLNALLAPYISHRALPAAEAAATAVTQRSVALGRVRWLSPLGVTGLAPLASVGPVAVGPGPAETSSLTADEVLVSLDAVRSLASRRPVLAVRGVRTTVDLVQGANLSWAGFPDDWEAATAGGDDAAGPTITARDWTPGLQKTSVDSASAPAPRPPLPSPPPPPPESAANFRPAVGPELPLGPKPKPPKGGSRFASLSVGGGSGARTPQPPRRTVVTPMPPPAAWMDTVFELDQGEGAPADGSAPTRKPWRRRGAAAATAGDGATTAQESPLAGLVSAKGGRLSGLARDQGVAPLVAPVSVPTPTPAPPAAAPPAQPAPSQPAHADFTVPPPATLTFELESDAPAEAAPVKPAASSSTPPAVSHRWSKADDASSSLPDVPALMDAGTAAAADRAAARASAAARLRARLHARERPLGGARRPIPLPPAPVAEKAASVAVVRVPVAEADAEAATSAAAAATDAGDATPTSLVFELPPGPTERQEPPTAATTPSPSSKSEWWRGLLRRRGARRADAAASAEPPAPADTAAASTLTFELPPPPPSWKPPVKAPAPPPPPMPFAATREGLAPAPPAAGSTAVDRRALDFAFTPATAVAPPTLAAPPTASLDAPSVVFELEPERAAVEAAGGEGAQPAAATDDDDAAAAAAAAAAEPAPASTTTTAPKPKRAPGPRPAPADGGAPAYLPAAPDTVSARPGLAARLAAALLPSPTLGSVSLRGGTLRAHVAGEATPRIVERVAATLWLAPDGDALTVDVTGVARERDAEADRCTMPEDTTPRSLRVDARRAPVVRAGADTPDARGSSSASSSSIVVGDVAGPLTGWFSPRRTPDGGILTRPTGGRLTVHATATSISTEPSVALSVQGDNLHAPLLERVLDVPIDVYAGRVTGELTAAFDDAASWRFPRLGGRVRGTGLDFHFWGSPDDCESVDVDLVLENDTLYVHRADGRYGAAPLRVAGDVRLDPEVGGYRLAADAAPTEINALRASLGVRPLPVPVAGGVAGSLHVSGALDAPVFSGTAVAVRPPPPGTQGGGGAAALEPSDAQTALAASPSAVAAYDRIPLAGASAVFALDTAADVLLLHSLQASPLGGGWVLGSGRLWTAPTAETNPRALRLTFEGGGVPADALVARYLPPGTRLPPDLALGEASGRATLAGSHIDAALDGEWSAPAARARAAASPSRAARSRPPWTPPPWPPA